jgi:3-oxoacyl-[acyl-carrier-protein] synthase-3
MNIQALAYYVPETYITNEDIASQNPEWPVDKISAKTGIYKRPVSGHDVLSSDLAYNAAERLFSSYAINRDGIDFLLFCTQSPDYFLPTTACLLQERLGLSDKIGALDYNLGCSGYIYGLSLAKGLICAHVAKNVLLLTGETYTKFIHPQDKSNKTLFGDGASATLVSAENGFAKIGDFSLGTDGRGGGNLIVKNGGFRNKALNGYDVLSDTHDFIKNDDYLFMNGNEIFSFTSKAVPVLVNDTLLQHNLELSDINLFIFHQANKYMLNFIRKIIGVSEDKFYINLTNTGNTVSSTIPIALKNAMNDGKIKQGDKVLIAGFGVGYSYGATILQF